MKDYYAILGVSTDAEIEVINAAYRAMAKKYHPDVYDGDKDFAEEKIKNINEAFENLSDIKKRKSYDKNFKQKSGSGSFDDYSETSDDNDKWHDDYLKETWETIIEFYPQAEDERKKLAKIQKKLAYQFQYTLIETKTSTNYEIMAKVIENDFFERYFGDSEELHKIVKNLLLKKEMKIAIEINKAIKILGSVATKDIIKKMRKKYGKKINNVNDDTYLNQSETIKRTIKNFEFEGKGNEQNYIYDYKYDPKKLIVKVYLVVYLDNDHYHEKPYPVLNFKINLQEKYLEQYGILTVENYFHYNDFYDLIEFIEDQLEKNA